MENTVFHPIFLPMFSILSIFTPTKHSVKVASITITMRVFSLDAKKMGFSLWMPRKLVFSGLIFGSKFFYYVSISKESLQER